MLGSDWVYDLLTPSDVDGIVRQGLRDHVGEVEMARRVVDSAERAWAKAGRSADNMSCAVGIFHH